MARRIHISLLLALMFTISPASTAKTGKRPRQGDGSYTLKVGGYLRGEGTAEVKVGQTMKLTLVVAPEGGGPQRYEIPLNFVARTKPYVTGDHMIDGKSAHFDGRVDVPDDARERAIRGVRLTCRIKSADGHYASVVGWVKELAEVEDAVDREDQGKGKGTGRNKD